MAESPVSRTKRELRKQEISCDVVERFNQYAGPYGIRQDFCGIFDIIAFSPEQGIIGIQCGGQSGHSGHLKKILANEESVKWLKSGGKIELWSWGKYKVKRGGKAIRWKPRIEKITLDYFEQHT